MVIDFVFKYLTPLFFFLPHLTSLSVEGCKKITVGRKGRDEDTFQLKLFRGLTIILWAGNCS